MLSVGTPTVRQELAVDKVRGVPIPACSGSRLIDPWVDAKGQIYGVGISPRGLPFYCPTRNSPSQEEKLNGCMHVATGLAIIGLDGCKVLQEL